MNLIGKYGISGEDDTFLLEFEMPVNCTCQKVTSGGQNYMEVVLPKGQTPSPTMSNHQATFVGTTTELCVFFKQIANGIANNKPIIKLEY